MKETLLIALFFCHFLADYTHLSTGWMLNAKKLGKPLFPILVHALVHASLMSVVIYVFITYVTGILSWPLHVEVDLFFYQLMAHFLIDVLKGRFNGWFPSLQSPANKWHWVVFGADQFLHALVIIKMVNYLIP